MHQLILFSPKPLEIDHVDGNGLNNQRMNLRICTHLQNTMNRKKSKGKSSVFKGVVWNKEKNNWRARIRVNKKLIHLGYFFIEAEAAKIYNIAAVKYFKEFARLNKVE